MMLKHIEDLNFEGVIHGTLFGGGLQPHVAQFCSGGVDGAQVITADPEVIPLPSLLPTAH
jgi:hypothetical protein